MKPVTLKALKASIVKWEKNARILYIDSATISPYSCPLCVLFFDFSYAECPVGSACAGCPVGSACAGTPYDDAMAAEEAGDVVAFRAASKREVAYLESLLPEGEV